MLALIPHRDILPALNGWRSALFAAGFSGARSLPVFCPLAVLRRPLTRDELRSAAAGLRALSGGGKFLGGLPVSAELPAADGGVLRVFGPSLSAGPEAPPIEPPDVYAGAIAHSGAPLLAAAVLGADDAARPDAAELPPAPPVSFRAAALANLVIHAAAAGEADYSFTWEFGPLRWLPRRGPNTASVLPLPETRAGRLVQSRAAY